MLPLLARIALDAAAFGYREGVVRDVDYERANLEPPADA